MEKYLLFLCLTACVYSATGNKAPFITKCNGEDSKCITAAAQTAIPILAAGIAELGVETMDPLNIASVNASSSNLQLLVKDVVVTGTKNCQAAKVERDVKNSKLFVNLLCDATMKGQYDMKGKLLFLPIEGKGDMRVILRKILIHAEVDLEEKVGKDSKNHWNIKKWKHEFELKDKSEVEFDNLFNGNELLAKTVKDLIAENGNEIILDIGPEIIKAVVAKVAKNCNHFFRAVPLEELVLS
ncbi:circadian clock-controlled protein daywake [Manduca sexta]|uniref:Uncharacterized protein n=1 Tax=Manduca sexta TaxID=7130 RepID=A0A921ZA49_MANSE|nr:circadian clock-controlled protein daywake [Manduca sexta]KAG6454228.1 hypothetical protein O3G_MSEX008576 [Manduca sexta]